MSTKSKNNQEILSKLEKISKRKLTLGALLFSIRQGDDMTQVAFAKKLKISKQYLCDIEHERRFISPKAAAEYADLLGYSSEQFVKLCLQDLINREGIDIIIDVKAA